MDVIVATAGGIEEDFIKCLAPTYIGDFALKGADLRTRGINRIGNLLVPNDNYCKFEDWLNPILDTMLEEQKTLVRESRDGQLVLNTHWTGHRVVAVDHDPPSRQGNQQRRLGLLLVLQGTHAALDYGLWKAD